MSEYVAIESFGITAPGEAYQAVEDGRTQFERTIPLNPSGGLMGLGHPLGATGVRMLLDLSKQLTGSAGDMQVDAAKTTAMFNVGGSCTTNCAFVVGV